MATQTSTPARRGFLIPLNVNSTIGSPSLGSKTGRAGEPRKLEEALLQAGVTKSAMSNAVHKEGPVLGTKRGPDSSDAVGAGNPKKRSKGDSATGSSTLQSHEETAESSLRIQTGVHRRRSSEMGQSRAVGVPSRPDEEAQSQQSSAPSSPASSGGFSEAALNDSQLTAPDDSQPQTRVVPTLTPDELRQKAQALKLRLRLASYKVRTNQLHVPLSRLQIRTIGNERISKSRTPLPFPPSPSSVPNILIHNPSAEEARQDMSSSPPPRLCNAASIPLLKKFESPVKTDGEARDGFATPLLPRHGLLNRPQLGSAIWDELSPSKELTSSVVKRGTADALLSLKHQR